jgi:uncharacterized protein with von Willebrand factor type A (vWA) domain
MYRLVYKRRPGWQTSNVVRAHLMAFVGRLRRAGVRISVAEALDAMAAVAAAGVARDTLREALAATLVKDEDDRASFDLAFDEHFPLLAPEGGSTGKGSRRGARTGGAGEPSAGSSAGTGSGGGGGAAAPRAPDERNAAPDRRETAAAARAGGVKPDAGSRAATPAAKVAAPGDDGARAARSEPSPRSHAAPASSRADAERAASAAAARRNERAPARDTPTAAAARDAADAAAPRIARRPFAELDPEQLDAARAAARELGRRFAARRARREQRTRRGRIDVRRTIRRAVSRGGALLELRRRGRRPGKPHLVVLCDVSGSVARASDLLLTMLAACEGAFGRVTRFAFVDHLVSVDFADGQIRPEGELDLYGFSDHGTVLAELDASDGGLIDRRTVLLVLGDARNNRRPARADALRRLALRARAVVWAVPEPRARWNTGDSALASYAASCDLVLEATSLAGLLAALRAATR